MSNSDKNPGRGQLESSAIDEARRRSSEGPREYTHVLNRVFKSIIFESNQLEGQRGTVPSLLGELARLSGNQRRLLVENSSRFRGWAMAEGLLERSRALWIKDPAHAEELATLAIDAIDHTEASGFRVALLNDLRAEAWSYIGNCRRIRSDLAGAEDAFRTAEQFLVAGSGDLMEQARFFDLKSSLLRARRDFSGATTLLSAAIRQYRASGDRHLEGRALIKSAKLLRDQGRVEDSIPLLRRAEALIDADRDPRTRFVIRHNLVLYLAEMGLSTEAHALIPGLREMAAAVAEGHDRLRVLWIEGVVLKSRGQLALAREALEQAREGFIAAELAYDVALISLEIAAIHLEAGDTQAVHRLASETMPLFAAQGIQRELLMAWNLLQRAAQRELATLQLVDDLRKQIRGLNSASLGSE